MARSGDVIEYPVVDRGEIPGIGGQKQVLWFVVLDADARRRAEEDAAIDAEDILTQAEEANALDPVG